jgi:tetratricopeptide (TPR) repeat protein
MSPDPTLDPNRTALPTPAAGSGSSDASDSTLVRTKVRTPGAGTSAPPGVLHIPGYEITGLIARGGMGAVVAGRDLTLDREVAIKTLLPGADPDRFVTEAKLAARLIHPGVPPVHALGTLPDGGHYLVMKLIHGRTLAKLLEDRPSPAADLPRFVQVFEQIAQAVGFAHSRGVLHRDLKPLNVMVGEFGEVQVMDWGLAKEARTAADAGMVMGTPSYMAPEQARGEAVDTRADVFALGSVLAAVLTGRPAFVGSTDRETIGKAAAADLADVLARLAGCGAEPELVALARRCLAANAADRPADARTVATEVADYRAGVEARLRLAETDRARAETQAAEEAKRRRVVQRAGGGIAAVLVLGIVGTAVGLFEARRQADNAREEAGQKELAREEEARQRGIAEENEKAAVRAQKQESVARLGAERAETRTADVLDVMVSVVTGESLATQKEISAEQKTFLTQVLPYYREFAAARGDDEKTRVRVARAAFRIGMIQSRLGRLKEGAAAFQQTRDELEKLVAEFPAVTEYRRNLAMSHTNLGVLLKDLGRGAGAEEQYRKAVAIQEKLVAAFPNVPAYRQDLAGSHTNLGVLLKDLGRHAEAEEQHRKALTIQEKLVAAFPNVPEYRRHLAMSHTNLGFLLADLGRGAEAEEQYR